jgi:hypothetical protein
MISIDVSSICPLCRTRAGRIPTSHFRPPTFSPSPFSCYALCPLHFAVFSAFRIPTSHFRFFTFSSSHFSCYALRSLFFAVFSDFRIFSPGIVPLYRTTTGPTSHFRFFTFSSSHLLTFCPSRYALCPLHFAVFSAFRMLAAA